MKELNLSRKGLVWRLAHHYGSIDEHGEQDLCTVIGHAFKGLLIVIAITVFASLVLAPFADIAALVYLKLNVGWTGAIELSELAFYGLLIWVAFLLMLAYAFALERWRYSDVRRTLSRNADSVRFFNYIEAAFNRVCVRVKLVD